MKQTDKINAPYLKVNHLMWQVFRQLSKSKKQILEQFGLTSSQFDILSSIYHFSLIKDEIIQIKLSEKTQIDPMTTSTILRNLQKKGLITRARGLINTRTVIVRITTQGEYLYEKAMSGISETTQFIYRNTNEKLLISQLLLLSDKLNILNL